MWLWKLEQQALYRKQVARRRQQRPSEFLVQAVPYNVSYDAINRVLQIARRRLESAAAKQELNIDELMAFSESHYAQMMLSNRR